MRFTRSVLERRQPEISKIDRSRILEALDGEWQTYDQVAAKANIKMYKVRYLIHYLVKSGSVEEKVTAKPGRGIRLLSTFRLRYPYGSHQNLTVDNVDGQPPV